LLPLFPQKCYQFFGQANAGGFLAKLDNSHTKVNKPLLTFAVMAKAVGGGLKGSGLL